jgi:NAD(P)-dependent dehydrogenase (short-subunit alcohol dehydrogenase family)
MRSFDGRTVLITGGGTGIGKGSALHFLNRGATVTIAGPDRGVLESAAAELRQATGRTEVRTAVCDVTHEEQVQEAVTRATDDGGLDVLVANGGTGWPGPVQLLDKAQWHIAYDVNVVGTALCIKHASSAMRVRGGGAVVAVSSVEALRAGKFMPAYNVTKAALDSLVVCAARELGGFGIRVNGVRPGVALTDAVQGQLTEKSIAAGLRQTYLGRLYTGRYRPSRCVPGLRRGLLGDRADAQRLRRPECSRRGELRGTGPDGVRRRRHRRRQAQLNGTDVMKGWRDDTGRRE